MLGIYIINNRRMHHTPNIRGANQKVIFYGAGQIDASEGDL